MNSLRNILGKFVKDFGIEGGVTLNIARKRWVSVVGKPVAAHTFPDTVKGGTLTIIVDTPQWMHHLSFYKDDIVSKLKPLGITGVRFRLGRLPVSSPEKHAAAAELSEEDLRYIENTVHGIEDEELKEKFRTLIRRGLTRNK